MPGMALATCVGLFLFTRILIPDVMLTLTITVALWGLLRALEEDEPHPARWAMAMWAAIGTRAAAEGADRGGISGGGGAALPGFDAAVAGAADVAAAAAVSRNRCCCC